MISRFFQERLVGAHPPTPNYGLRNNPQFRARSLKKGQVSVFIIVAVVIIVGVIAFLIFREDIGGETVPQNLAPVFDYYQSCIEKETRTAVQLAGIQGGRVYVGDYIPGSEYAPFSSQLNFLGGPIPYWYYMSGNGIIKEQVPSLQDMESDIAQYVTEGLRSCDFEYYYRQGFSVNVGEPIVNVEISDLIVSVEVDAEMTAEKEGDSARKKVHKANIQSKLGKFYTLARSVYNAQKKDAILENYAADVLYSYAPVDGVLLQCNPQIWSTREITDELKDNLEYNFATIKFDGDYYTLSDDVRKYFVVDVPVDESVQVMYSKQWPTKVEIYGEGVDDELMIAEAVGLQEGLGILGFCYIPYHYVYDVSFPALIQIYDSGELFQFPVVVIIDNNVPREAIIPDGAFVDEESSDLCEYRTQQLTVHFYDANLNNVDANVSYECFDQSCRIGESSDGEIKGAVPACVNGYLKVRAGGYAEKKYLFSSNEQSFAEIVLDREYPVSVSLLLGGRKPAGISVVSFVRDDGKTVTAALPDSNEVKLSEGSYEVQVYSYGNSSVVIPSSSRTECVEVPREGLLGLFGSTKENCFDISIPETKIESALIGGGHLQTYLLESDLKKGNMTIEASRFPTPQSLEQLSDNFGLYETEYVEVSFDE